MIIPNSIRRSQLKTAAKNICLAGVLLGAFKLNVSEANAVAFRLPNQDPDAISRGNAFVATADNPSAIYYNPAGITQLKGSNLRVGMYLVSAGTDYTAPNGNKESTDKSFQAVPQVYFTYTPEDSPISLGLGIYAPYGLSLDWGKGGQFDAFAQYGRLLYASINPVMAWQVNPTLSLAIGPTINYSETKLENASFLFKGDGTDVGFNAGIFWHPVEKWAFGVSYRYETTINYKGDASAVKSGSLRFPQYVMGGISFRPTEKWNIEIDADWTDWNNVDSVVFRDASGTPLGALVLNYKSGMMYGIGVTRKLSKGYYVNAGYFFSENSSGDANFGPVVPDGDMHLPGVGVGHKGEKWDWAFGFHCGIGNREVKNSPNPNINGKYETFNPAFNLSTTYKF